MANWYGSARTNYVRLAKGVTIDDLRKRLDLLDLGLEIWTQGQDEDLKVGFGPGDMTDDGAFPGFIHSDIDEDDERLPALMKLLGYDDQDEFLSAIYNDEIEFDWGTLIMPMVEAGEVLVVQTIGAEKLRYLTGRADAFVRNEDGVVRHVGVSISDIYKTAHKAFGLDEARQISLCEY